MKSKKVIVLFGTICLMICGLVHAQHAGVVKTLRGEAQIIRSGQAVKLELGDRVYIADQLATDANGSLGILFRDDTRLGAGPDTRFSIDSYQFENASQAGHARLSVDNGTLALVGGKLVLGNPDAIKVYTPDAVLSVPCSHLSVKVDLPNKDAP